MHLLGSCSIENDAVVLGLEPLHAIILLQPVLDAELASLQLPILHTQSWTRQMHVEVHAVDTCRWVVLDAETKRTVVGKVLLPQLILLHLQSPVLRGQEE